MPLTRYIDRGGTLIDLADGMTTAEAVTLAKSEVKRIAKTKIDAGAPVWKQRNYIARGLELERKDRRQGLTVAEQSEADAIQAFWDQVKAIRAASDQIETDIDAAATNPGTPHAVLDVKREDNPAWP